MIAIAATVAIFGPPLILATIAFLGVIMPAPPIAHSVHFYQHIRSMLLSEDPDIDETTLADTLEGCTDLQERLIRIADAVLDADGSAEVLTQRIKDFLARKRRFEARADRLRAIILWAMGEADLKTISAPELTLSVGKSRSAVIITDPHLVPPRYVDYDPVPRKADIRAALEAGEDMVGVSLSNAAPSLTIRTK